MLILLGVLCLVSVLPTTGHAAAAPPTDSAMQHRVLVVIETSSASRVQADGIVRVLGEMVGEGMGGQMRPGDTLGVWTFNQQIHSGEFPLHRWSNDSKHTLPEQLGKFLAGRKFEKKPNFSEVLRAMGKLMADSDLITVILILSGESPISGTAVDEQANQFFDTWKSQQQKARMPFVVVLRGYKRVFTDFSLNTPPWKIEFPPLPPEVLMAAKITPLGVGNRPVAKGPSLIVSGRKPSTNAVATATSTSTTNDQSGPAATVAATVTANTVPAAQSNAPAPTATLASALPGDAAATPATKNAGEAPPILLTSPSDLPPNSRVPPGETTASPNEGKRSTASAPQLASAATRQPFGYIFWFGSAGAGFLLLAGAWLYYRRSQPKTHISLITESLDNEQSL